MMQYNHVPLRCVCGGGGVCVWLVCVLFTSAVGFIYVCDVFVLAVSF